MILALCESTPTAARLDAEASAGAAADVWFGVAAPHGADC
jgi:hypothetical protein